MKNGVLASLFPMSTIRTGNATDEILAQADWVRALARRLVRDEAAAEDLAQETLVLALDAAPTRVRSWRAWLSTVLHNARAQDARAEGRRQQRERACARSVAQSAEPVVAEQLKLHRALVDAVEALAEPYRSTVWLRFFEDLPPRKIAARLEVPVKTVSSRLHRGLAMLRAQLRGQHGDGFARSLLLPLCGGSGWRPVVPGSVTTLGAAIMGTKLKILTFVVVAAVCATLFWPRSLPTEASTTPAKVAAPAVLHGRGGGGGGAAAGAVASSRRPVRNTRGTAASAPTPPPTRTLRGRVLDVDATPLGDTALQFVPAGGGESVAVVSAEQGWFEAVVPDVAGEVVAARDTDLITVMRGVVLPDSEVPPVVVVGHPIDLGGVVMDDKGQPVANATVRGVPPTGFMARFEDVLDASAATRWLTRSNQRGQFALAKLPLVAGGQLEVTHPKFRAQRVDAPGFSDRSMWIELAPTQATRELLGRVVFADGSPVPSAQVGLGLLTSETDDRGEFSFDLDQAHGEERLLAVKSGYRIATATRPQDTGRWPDYVELVLPGDALSISGRVVDADGLPVEGANVWVADPTLLGMVNGLPVQAENLGAGVAMPRSRGQPPPRGVTRDITMPQRGPSAHFSWVTTERDGSFVLRGLDDRDYQLHVLDRGSLQLDSREGVAAGSTGVDVMVAGDGLHDVVKARVVSLSGKPIKGVRVRLIRRSFGAVFDTAGGGTFDLGMMTEGQSARTDAEGRFVMKDVPVEGTFLYLLGDHIVEHVHHLGADAGEAEVEVRVPASCHLQVEWTPDADAVAVYDKDGRRLDLTVRSGRGVNAYDSVPLTEGRSAVIAVDERAAELVLLQAGAEMLRLPLNLAPGEVTTIRP